MAELVFGIAACLSIDLQTGSELHLQALPQGDKPDAPQPPSPVPSLLRRRISPIGQSALRAAWSLPQIANARFVFASRHGEFDRTLAMLEQVADGDGPSPADFSLGVHNALAGLLSVTTRNRRGHAALAAGIDTFGFALMEAGCCLREQADQPVVVVYYDAPLPASYPDRAPACAEPALAMALTVVAPGPSVRRVGMTASPRVDATPGEAAASVFLGFLHANAPEAEAIGESMRWAWRRA